MIPYSKQDEVLIVFDRDGWCFCNNSNEIFTEELEDSFGFDSNNWLGSLDGFNILHRSNMVLDKYQDILKKGVPKYISHTQFDMLDKALNYEYSLILRYVKLEYRDRKLTPKRAFPLREALKV